MGAAAPVAAVGLSLAATGTKVAGEYYSSRGASQADVYKAELLEQQAQYGELKAQQTNAQMTRNLAITLGHIDAVRAAAHTDATSPTGAAVRGMTEEIGTERKGIAVENILQQVRMDEANAAYMRKQAGDALMAGNISMLATAFSGAAGAMGASGGASPDLSQPLPGGAPMGQGGIGSA
jgi:hypothetical protein